MKARLAPGLSYPILWKAPYSFFNSVEGVFLTRALFYILSLICSLTQALECAPAGMLTHGSCSSKLLRVVALAIAFHLILTSCLCTFLLLVSLDSQDAAGFLLPLSFLNLSPSVYRMRTFLFTVFRAVNLRSEHQHGWAWVKALFWLQMATFLLCLTWQVENDVFLWIL